MSIRHDVPTANFLLTHEYPLGFCIVYVLYIVGTEAVLVYIAARVSTLLWYYRNLVVYVVRDMQQYRRRQPMYWKMAL